MTLFNVSCVFDINCPWCYIDHTYLSRTIISRRASRLNDTFNITLIPLYLKYPPQLSDPSMPPFAVQVQSCQKLREETYGKGYADAVLQNIQLAAKEAGLNLKFNGQTGTTRNGHRLIQHAQRIGGFEKAESTLHSLFKLYHEEEFDITQLSVLTDVGVERRLSSICGAEKMARWLTKWQRRQEYHNPVAYLGSRSGLFDVRTV